MYRSRRFRYIDIGSMRFQSVHVIAYHHPGGSGASDSYFVQEHD